ncbi:MAG: signal peptide peptidase SppA, partial [Bryocella sp.]
YAAPYAAAPYAYAAPYPGAHRRSGWFWAAVIIAIVGVVIVAIVGMMSLALKSSFNTGSKFGKNSIAVIDISGVIVDADKIDKQLDKFADDSNVKAIILHINSPGGGAAASQEIYHEVLRVRQEKHKRVVASVESMGASGAYYIASACDRIYANQASVVGSIGVIMEWTNFGDLMKWAKLKPVIISRGELKDAGDPTRDMTPQERVYFQSLVDNMYSQFVHDVAVGRGTTDDAIRPLATGQVWTGQQALPLKLIDQEGGFQVALTDTAKAVGISGKPNIVRPAKPASGLLGLLNGEAGDIFPNPTKLLERAPGFYFLWK